MSITYKGIKNKFLINIEKFFDKLGAEKFFKYFIDLLRQLSVDKNIYVKANSGEALIKLTEKMKNFQKNPTYLEVQVFSFNGKETT